MNAIGLTGADGNIILASKRVHATIDYGWVGDVEKVNDEYLKSFLDQEITVVIAPITHNGQGSLLNTNADTIAQEIATAMAKHYAVQLVFSFEKTGVLTDLDDDKSVIPVLSKSLYKQYQSEHKIFAGMIPKLDNAFTAIEKGVDKVFIGKAEQLENLITGKTGTTLTHE
jgi:acetylglutamate kinase